MKTILIAAVLAVVLQTQAQAQALEFFQTNNTEFFFPKGETLTNDQLESIVLKAGLFLLKPEAAIELAKIQQESFVQKGEEALVIIASNPFLVVSAKRNKYGEIESVILSMDPGSKLTIGGKIDFLNAMRSKK